MAEDLVGMSFLRLEDDGACKGAVLARVGAEHYLLEVVAWSGDGISEITVVPVTALASRGCCEGYMFFRSAEARDAWYEELCSCGDEDEDEDEEEKEKEKEDRAPGSMVQ
jgi:hypothetical protein